MQERRSAAAPLGRTNSMGKSGLASTATVKYKKYSEGQDPSAGVKASRVNVWAALV